MVGNRPNGFGIHQYIKDSRKSNYHLFNNMLRGRKNTKNIIKKGRKLS